MKKLLATRLGRMLLIAGVLFGILIWAASSPTSAPQTLPLPTSTPTLTPTPEPSPTAEAQEEPFPAEEEYMVVVDGPTRDIHVILSREYVEIEPFESPYHPMVIWRKDYPDLFEKWESRVNFMCVRKFEEKLNQRLFIILGNCKLDHGGYSYDYAIIVYLDEGRVVYEVPDYFLRASFPFISPTTYGGVLEISGSRGHYAYANSRQLRFIEYISYDPARGKFVPVNNLFKKEFSELLKEYEEIAQNGCLYKGEIWPFEAIQSKGGDEARCESELFPGGEFSYFIPMSEYYARRQRIEDIISEFSPGGEFSYFIPMSEYYARRQRIEDIIGGKAESMAL